MWLRDRRTGGKGSRGGGSPALCPTPAPPALDEAQHLLDHRPQGSWRWEQENGGKRKIWNFLSSFVSIRRPPFASGARTQVSGGGWVGRLCAQLVWCPHSSVLPVLPTVLLLLGLLEPLDVSAGVPSPSSGREGVGTRPCLPQGGRHTSQLLSPWADGTCVGLFRKPRPKSWAMAGEPHAAPSGAALHQRWAPRT